MDADAPGVQQPDNPWWLAIGLVLILEGLLPLIAPARWRETFSRLLQLQDGQLRFMGMVAVLGGLAMFWLG